MITAIPIDDSRLLALIQNPGVTRHEWVTDAVCAGTADSGTPYHPDDGDAPCREALALCIDCPVRCECLASALIHEAVDGQRDGWWGGIGPDERDALWLQLGRPLIPSRDDIDLGSPAAIARYLRKQKMTVTQIAAELGCSERTVHRYLAATAA